MKHVDEVWLIGGVYGWDIQVDESRYYIFTESWGSSESQPHSNLTKFDGNLKTEGFHNCHGFYHTDGFLEGELRRDVWHP